jgi:subtilisin family serine protease
MIVRGIPLSRWFVAVFFAWLGSVAARAAPMPDSGSPERQLLVMLRAVPPHFRPDTAYAPAYSSVVRQPGQRRIAETLAKRHDLVVVDSWPMPALGVDCFVMEAGSPAVAVRALEQLGHEERVESAQRMNVFIVLGHDDPLYPLQRRALGWDLADVHRFATGKDVRVAEIDSGVELDHPDLRGRIAITRNFANSPAASEAHGTAVAGIIAARADDGIGIAGVAPEAELHALRACEEAPNHTEARCTTFALAKALQFALEHDVQVINLCLGGPRDRLLERLLDVIIGRGIIVVSAADARATDGGFPASHADVLSVASADALQILDTALRAPGRDVPTTTVGRSWGFVSGSSYAAASISGLVALLLERNPEMRVAQVRRALVGIETGSDVPAQSVVVDACAAVMRTANACVCGCPFTGPAVSSAAH